MNQMLGQILNAYLSNHRNAPLTETEQNYVDVLKSGDNNAGEALATKLCQNMGVSREQAYAQAKQFFGL